MLHTLIKSVISIIKGSAGGLLSMPSKHTLIRGAFILTAAGFISRFMGFFFRIFLSHAFGEENVGLYQLIFPVYALCHSIGTAGIETALSRTVARKISLNRYREAKAALFAALFFTVSVSLLEIILIQQNADAIAVSFLGDQRCTEMLVIISYALPCSAVHCCICGYSFGLQKTEVPAISQLVEQTVRILFVIGVFFYISGSGGRPSISLAAAGVVAGEFFSLLYSARILSKILRIPGRFSLAGLKKPAGELMRLSLPLTANRTAVTLLQSVEAASIPASLKLFGMDTSDALSTYGVLTGMALPCILFPSAVTSSVGTVLMPAVTKAQADGDPAGMAALIRKAASGCFLLGLACCLFFLLSGSFLGEFLFHSSSAGKFILTLAWMCPFLYTNAALISSINGLGKTTSTFLINMLSLGMRITSVFLAIPRCGILGYLWGLLASQAAVTVLAFLVLYRTGRKTFKTPHP